MAYWLLQCKTISVVSGKVSDPVRAHSHTASFMVCAAVTYLASVVDKATMGCFWNSRLLLHLQCGMHSLRLSVGESGMHGLVTNDGGVIVGVCEFEIIHGLEVSDHSFGCLPVDPSRALAELGQYGGHKCDVRPHGHGSVHE